MRPVRIISLAAILLLLGGVLSLASAVVAAAWSNVDSWREERPVRPSPSHLPAYLRGVWSDPIEVTTNRGAAWGVSQTTITCVELERWPQGAAGPLPDPDVLPRVYVLRSSFGWPMRCMHYDRFGTTRNASGAGIVWFARELDARAGRCAGGPFPAWFPYDHGSWMGAQRRMPRAVLWPGLAGNTLFYAAVALLLLWIPRTLRRRARRRRGLCEWCAYPVGVSSVCTECGATLPATGHRRAPA